MSNVLLNCSKMISIYGPVRLSTVEEAQQRIVAIIRRLDEAGEIITRGDQNEVII